LNLSYLLKHNYLAKDPDAITLKTREEAVRSIIKNVHGGSYRLTGKGVGSQFESFLMPYDYLGWYLGNQPTIGAANYTFSIEEKESKVEITKLW
jgi:hypothetical protein